VSTKDILDIFLSLIHWAAQGIVKRVLFGQPHELIYCPRVIECLFREVLVFHRRRLNQNPQKSDCYIHLSIQIIYFVDESPLQRFVMKTWVYQVFVPTLEQY